MYVSQNFRLFLSTATIITCHAELSSKFPWLSLARKRKMLDIKKDELPVNIRLKKLILTACRYMTLRGNIFSLKISKYHSKNILHLMFKLFK